MGVAPLLVDAGEVTIMFSLAAFTWGKWDEMWPEGATKPELPQGRVLGYVGALRNKPKGRFSYRFVRGDVSVNAVDHVSTVEQTLDEAAKRVEGDLFVEQDISLPGLGLMRPGVDFSVGDVVPIRVWGRVLRLPVTSVEAVTGDSGVVVDWRVHVGGQLVLNRDAVRASNDSLLRTIAQERRERRGAVAGVLEAAKSDAKAKADKALSDAKTYAGGLVTPVATRLDQLGQDFKTQTGRVDTLTTSQEGTASKLQAVVNGDPGGLLTGTAFEKNQRAINEMQAVFNAEQVGINTGFRKLFALQDEINAQTTELDRAQTARITDLEQLQAIRDVMDRNTEKMLNYVGDFAQYVQNRSYMLIRREYVTGGYGGYYTSDYGNYFTLDQSKSDRVTIKIVNKWSGFLDYSVYSSDGRSERYVSTVKNGVITQGFGTGRSDTFIKWGSQKISTYVITAVPGTWPNGSESVPPKFPRLEPLPIVKKG